MLRQEASGKSHCAPQAPSGLRAGAGPPTGEPGGETPQTHFLLRDLPGVTRTSRSSPSHDFLLCKAARIPVLPLPERRPEEDRKALPKVPG